MQIPVLRYYLDRIRGFAATASPSVRCETGKSQGTATILMHNLHLMHDGIRHHQEERHEESGLSCKPVPDRSVWQY